MKTDKNKKKQKRTVQNYNNISSLPSPHTPVESDQYGTWTVKLSEWAQHDSGEIVASASNFMGTVATRCRVRIVPEGTPIPRDETDSRRSISSSSKVGFNIVPEGDFRPYECECFFLRCFLPLLRGSE